MQTGVGDITAMVGKGSAACSKFLFALFLSLCVVAPTCTNERGEWRRLKAGTDIVDLGVTEGLFCGSDSPRKVAEAAGSLSSSWPRTWCVRGL